MMNFKPPDYKFCPFCGEKLKIRNEEHKERKFCTKDNWTYYPRVATAAVAMTIKDGKILLVQRAHEPYKGKWVMPAGFVDYGEHPKETLLREVTEETGFTVASAELFDIVQVEDDPRELGHFAFVYKVNVTDGKGVIDHEENMAIEWHDLKNLPELGWEYEREILHKIVNEC